MDIVKVLRNLQFEERDIQLAADEIERLRGELDAAEQHVRILRVERDALKRDAGRYRALRYAIAHNIDPDYQGVMNDEIPVSEQMEDLDKVVDVLKVKVDAALAAKGE